MSSILVGMFDTQAAAEQARTKLVAAGFAPGQITGSGASSTAGTGTVPAAAPAESEGVISHFFRSIFGDEEDTASNPHVGTYQEAFRRGGYGLTVPIEDESMIDKATDILDAAGAVDVDERSAQWRGEGWKPAAAGLTSAAATTGNAAVTGSKIDIVEESLSVGKRSVGQGGVRVFSRIVETPVQETVRLREETADVQRRVVDRPATEADFAAFKEGSMEVRTTAEEAVVSKSARVVGEVVVGRKVTERDEVIHDSVRKTEVDVEQIGATATSRPTEAYASAGTVGGSGTMSAGSPNRDPLSGELGAHPVGTGVGAAAGGVAAGAAVGSVAGPVGTVIGAAVGAVAGGLAGKGVAEKVDPTVPDTPSSKAR